MLTTRTPAPSLTPLRAVPVTRQTGIRQRSLGPHCRLGRATELVFVLVTGVTLVLAGGAEAQVVWDGATDTDFQIGTNWVGDVLPGGGDDAVLDNGALGNQPTLSGAITVNTMGVSAGTLTVAGTGALTAPTVTLSGTGNLTIDSGGSVIGNVGMSGAQLNNFGTIDGTLEISSGSVDVFGSGEVTGTTTITGGSLTNDGTLADVDNQAGGTFTNQDLASVAGAVTNAGTGSNAGEIDSLTNTGGTFGNSGVIGGSTDVSGGSVTLNAGSNLADAAAVTVATPGALVVNTAETIGSLAGNGSVTLGATLTTGGDNTSTEYSGAASGTGGITKAGTNSFMLSNVNTYAGATTVSAGTLDLNGSGSIASTVVSTAVGAALTTDGGGLDANAVVTNAGTLALTGGGGEVVNSVSGAGAVTLSSGSFLTLDTGTSTISGAVSGLGGLTITGTSATTLSGANSYDGATTVNAGATLTAASNTALGSTTGTTTVDAGGTLALTGGITTAEEITLSGTGVGGGGALRNLAGNNTATIAVALLADTQINSDAGVLTLSGGITGTGSVTKDGAGLLALSGSNTYTGSTTVNGGTLDVTGSVASTVVAVNAGGTLQVNGTSLLDTAAVTLTGTGNLTAGSETIGSLTGAATSTVTLGANTLTTGDANPTEFAGVASGTGGITKQGTGTFTLSGANLYTGATTVNAGVLSVTGSVAGDVTVDAAELIIGNSNAIGGTITTTGSIITYANGVNEASAVILNSTDTQLQVAGTDAAEQSGVISETGGARPLEKIGTGTLTLSAANTYTGATRVTAGTLALTGNGALASADISIEPNATLRTDGGALNPDTVLDNMRGALDLVSGGDETVDRIVTGAGVGSIALSSGSVLTLDAGTSTISGVISGNGGLTIAGTSGTTLSGINSYTGGTTVTVGATLTNDGTLVSEVTNAGAFTNNGTAADVTNEDGGFAENSGTTLAVLNDGVETEFYNYDGGIAGAVTNRNEAYFANTGSTAGNVTNQTAARFYNDGGTTGGVTNQTGGIFDNDGGATLAVLNDGAGTEFYNYDGGLTGAVTNRNGAAFNNQFEGTTGAVTNTGDGTVFSNEQDATTGNVTNADQAYFENQGTIDGDLAVEGGFVVNDGGLVIGGTTITGDGDMDNYGTLQAVSNSSSIDYGFRNFGTATDLTNAGFSFNDIDGTLQSVVNIGGIFDNEGDVTGPLDASGGFARNRETGTVGGLTTITGDGVVLNFGALAAVDNASQGTEESFENGFANLFEGTTGAVTNTGFGTNFGEIAALTNAGGAIFDTYGVVTGAVANSGEAYALGSIGGGVTNTGFLAVGINAFTAEAIADGALEEYYPGLSLDGAPTLLTLNGSDLLNTGGGLLDVLNGSTLTLGTLTNQAGSEVQSTGTINGTVANSGAVRAAGGINGNVTNAGSFLVTGALTSAGGAFANTGAGTLNVTGGDFTGLATLVNASTAAFGVTVDAGRTLGVGTFTNQSGARALNNGTLAVAAATLINDAGATFINNGVVSGPVVNSGTLISNNGSSFSGGTFVNTAPGLFEVNGTVSVGGAASNAGTIDMANGSTADRLNFGSTLAAGGTVLLDANLTQGAQSADVITVAGATSGAPRFAFTILDPAKSGVGQDILFFNTNGGTFTLDPSQVSGLASTGSVITSVAQAGAGADLFLVTQANPAIGGLAANISLTQSLITTVVNRPTSPLVDLGRVEGEACRSGGFARVGGGEATVSGESNNGQGAQEASIDSSFGSIQAGWDSGCYDGRFNDWDLAFGGLVGLTTGSTSQDIFEANAANAALLTNSVVGNLDTDFDQTSVGLYMAARRDRFLADVQLRYDDTDFDFTESTAANATPIGLNGASASSQALTLAARINYVYALNSPGLNFIPNAGFSYTRTDGDTVNFTNGSGQSLVLDSYNTMIGFAGGTLAKTVAGDSGRDATTTFLTANYYQDFGDDPTSVFYDGFGGSQAITTSNIGGYGEIGIGLNYFADVTGKMGGVQRLNAAVRADVRSGDNVSDAYALTAQFRLSF